MKAGKLRSSIYLGQWVEEIVYGEPVRTISWTAVKAQEKSIRQSEFYESMNAGLKPEIVYVIRNGVFDNHEFVKCGTKEYAILRSYKTCEGTELTCGSSTGSEV